MELSQWEVVTVEEWSPCSAIRMSLKTLSDPSQGARVRPLRDPRGGGAAPEHGGEAAARAAQLAQG